MKIEKARHTGFCFGVRRAIDLAEKAAAERHGLDTLGAIVHNRQVLEHLARLGIRAVNDIDDIRGKAVVISSHGISPQRAEAIRSRQIDIIDTTCPFVHRAQLAARRLAKAGFFVAVYGEAEHPEVKGILGWAQDKGIATMDVQVVASLDPLPRRIGLLSQTTQTPEQFAEFAKKLIDVAFTQNSELHIIDTICHDIRARQAEAVKLARKVDLMLVVGGRSSANTNHLAQLCARLTETHLIETAAEIQSSLLEGKRHIGIVSGASTDEATVNEVVAKLEEMNQSGANLKR